MEQRVRLVMGIITTGNELQRRLDLELGHIKGVSFSEYQLLSALADGPAEQISRTQLAELVGLTPSGVTRALRPLERLGFVESIRDERDARRSLSSLTPAGRELVDDARQVVVDKVEDLTALDVRDDEMAAVSELLDRLRRA